MSLMAGILLFLLWQAFFCFFYGRHSSVSFIAEVFFSFSYGKHSSVSIMAGILLFLLWQRLFFLFSYGSDIISPLKDQNASRQAT